MWVNELKARQGYFIYIALFIHKAKGASHINIVLQLK